jgi:electron transport complex protein RnfD
MADVLIALILPVLAGSLVFGMLAAKQLVICLGSALFAELLFNAMRKKPFSLKDGSAAVTGVILALSIPASAPWYVGVIGSVTAIGLGKIIFGGLGFNLFNPAMVGRAFVMIAFPALLGASAYIIPDAKIDVLTTATPLTAFKMEGMVTGLRALIIGTTNGSIGETSTLACLVGGLYLCVRRTAAWQIPVGVIASAALISALLYRFDVATVIHELTSGALIFGAFYIATDPVTSPVTPKGRWIFGIFVGCMIMLLRKLSGYPEGVMFAVLMANMVTPLINRWTVPTPVGGPVPVRK